MLLKCIISLFFSTAESTIPLQPFPGLGWGVIYNKQTHSCCFIACVFALFPILVLFQSVTTKKIDSEHTKLFSVCKVEILQVTLNEI